MAAERIEKVWELRFAGKVSEAFALLQDFEPATPLDRAEAYLLNCSFSRHAGKLDDAFEWIEKAKAELKDAGLAPTFQLCLQTGITLDVQSKFADSLQYYQEAVKLAKTEFERVISKVNLAICRYNLSLPFGELLKEFGDLTGHPLANTVKQLRLIELKSFLRDGKLDAATALHFPALTQGLYLQAWIESLPFHQGEKKNLARFRELASSEASYFQKNYLLQTLQADPRLSATDDTEVPVQERADRIYLWTWRWLENPASVTRTLLEQELSRFPFETAHLTMTDEDFLLLRSAGAWLGLFNSAFDSRFQEWKDKYFPTLPAAHLFDREQALIDAIRRNDIAPVNALAKDAPALHALVKKLFLEKNAAHDTAPGALHVRLSDSRLQAGGEKLISEPLARLLTRIKKDGSLAFEACAQEVFGLRVFDSLDHGPKIHNLLQRAKKLLPAGCELSTKNQRIYLEGDAAKIQIDEGSVHERHFPELTWPELDKKQSVGVEKKQAVDFKAKLLLAFEDKQSLSRADVQKILGLSKATTSRLLLGWAQEGFLKAKGAGASRAYELAAK